MKRVKRVLERDVYRAKELLCEIIPYIDTDFESWGIYRSMHKGENLKEIHDLLRKFGIKVHWIANADTTVYSIYVDKSYFYLNDKLKRLLNDDTIVKFLVYYLDDSYGCSWSHFDREVLESGSMDGDIFYTLQNIMIDDPLASNIYLVYRYYSYPILPIMFNMFWNYNIWEIVEKIKGIWV